MYIHMWSPTATTTLEQQATSIDRRPPSTQVSSGWDAAGLIPNQICPPFPSCLSGLANKMQYNFFFFLSPSALRNERPILLAHYACLVNQWVTLDVGVTKFYMDSNSLQAFQKLHNSSYTRVLYLLAGWEINTTHAGQFWLSLVSAPSLPHCDRQPTTICMFYLLSVVI